MFETQYTITKASYKEMRWLSISTSEKIWWAACTLFGVIFLIIGIQDSSPIWVLAGILFIPFAPVVIFWSQKRTMKLNMQREQERTGTTDIFVQTSFDEEGITSFDPKSNYTGHIRYASVRKFAETKSMYVLITKTRQYMPVNKATLAQAGETEAFLQFIKSKLPHVKIKRP